MHGLTADIMYTIFQFVDFQRGVILSFWVALGQKFVFLGDPPTVNSIQQSASGSFNVCSEHRAESVVMYWTFTNWHHILE